MISCPVIAICGPAPLAGIPGLRTMRRAAPPVTAGLLAAAAIPPAPAPATFGPGAALSEPPRVSAFRPVERPAGPGGAPEAASRDRGAEGGEQ
ncbi:aminotransferase, class V/cysteine desulfurase [Rhodovulum sulfidophilum]|uniref:Aminotransferase, class V/cysteine desulfurase n=1 Tax=Rhodovulum sulfidophilum TaxID=35806 RepID=A0A0D6B5S1_RHOSU|nr:aminotransferase, class V/cysteine desulfurase [Rhodovulum sulfidophilum]